MKSDGDYLWDKTGEPDPEIQQLEEILGTLRYQPRPLEIPTDLQTESKAGFLAALTPRLAPRLAIAATLVIVLFGLGLWFGLQVLQRGQSTTVVKTPSTPAPGSSPGSTTPHTPNGKQNEVVTLPDSKQRPIEGPRRQLARNPKRTRNDAMLEERQLEARNLREGRAAKDQLMLALRVASAKLNFAQKKMQNTNPRGPVHNQHKIG